MNDPELRRKYKKCKYVAKMWEKDFQRKHGNIPSKYDIHDAPRKIRDAYKLYYQLKKSLDKEISSEKLMEESIDSTLEISQDTSNASQSFSQFLDMSQPKNVWGDEVSNKKPPAEPETSKKAEASTSSYKTGLAAKLFANCSFQIRNPRKALSRTTSLPAKSISSLSLGGDADEDDLPDIELILMRKVAENNGQTVPLAPSVSQDYSFANKMDKGWLSRHFSDSSLTGFDTPDGSLPAEKRKFGLSNVNAELIPQFTLPDVSSAEIPLTNEQQTKAAIKENGVLSVVNEIETSKLTLPHNSGNAQNDKGQPREMVGDDDSDSVVENSEDESPKRRFENIRPSLKRRKVESENGTDASPKFVSTKMGCCGDAENSTKQDNLKKIDEKANNVQTDEDENTHNADDESFELKVNKSKRNQGTKKKSQTRKTSKSNKSDKPKAEKQRKNPARMKRGRVEEPEELSEDATPCGIALSVDSNKMTSLPSVNMRELSDAEQVIKKFIYDDNENRCNAPSVKKVEPKLREISNQDNLASRLASGRVNENYVRINIKKKVFVRGKKTMNFSKYKRNLWKQKKAAALCGPEMDMGGCDGGILKCFKCGLPGHFAQRCPTKGDSLLPVGTTDVDESPFPSLDEAEQMAKEKAMAVHSKNIEKLPASANQMIYKDNGSSSEKENVNDEADVEMLMESKTGKENRILHANPPEMQTQTQYIGHKIPLDLMEKAGLLKTDGTSDQSGPLYNLDCNGHIIEPTKEVLDVLKMFGHKDFRKGQEKAVMRILSGVSTLVTLSTGSGKSLCYQLPAYLYSKKKGCITLVVSPLVSLMEDQVHGVPAFLNAQCLHTNQTATQRQNVMEMISKSQVDVLLVSPEAIVAGERSTGFGSILRSLPPIAFACIDEVHCVSQWSHNFRPSYLMICKVLKTKLGVRTILGLTATATFQTRESIIKHLNIPDGMKGIICDVPLPENLFLSVSKDEQRDFALVELLKSPRFAECQSIIVYCTRREECERVATFVRTCLQDTQPAGLNSGKRKRVNWCAEPYHAGMAASRRRTVQKTFMQNDLRIVVATVAFGMGINKPDIRAVIHYNMPKTFESYVQEVGRSGRDGLPSHCHLFLDSKGSDQNELRRHIYANSIDRHVIRKLLEKVFVQCSCSKNIKEKDFLDEYAKEIEAVQTIDWDEDYFAETKVNKKRICPGHEIGIPIANTVELLDIPEENISTLLCYLELDGRWGLKTLSNGYIMCKVISYGGPIQIKKAAKECPPLAMAIALQIKQGKFDETANIIEFSAIEIASAIGWNSGIVKYQLKNLEWTTANGLPKRSNLSVNFYELGFRIQSPGDFTDDELDEALDVLFNRAVNQEKTQVIQLQQVFEGLSSVAYKSHAQCSGKYWSCERVDRLKNIIREYFKQDLTLSSEVNNEVDTSHDDRIINDVQNMIYMYPDNNFTGRSLARIFHGIQSPNYPALMWSRCKYWRAHSKVDFNHIVKLANAVIIEMRR